MWVVEGGVASVSFHFALILLLLGFLVLLISLIFLVFLVFFASLLLFTLNFYWLLKNNFIVVYDMLVKFLKFTFLARSSLIKLSMRSEVPSSNPSSQAKRQTAVWPVFGFLILRAARTFSSPTTSFVVKSRQPETATFVAEAGRASAMATLIKKVNLHVKEFENLKNEFNKNIEIAISERGKIV